MLAVTLEYSNSLVKLYFTSQVFTLKTGFIDWTFALSVLSPDLNILR
jgi:hypothetical protein